MCILEIFGSPSSSMRPVPVIEQPLLQAVESAAASTPPVRTRRKTKVVKRRPVVLPEWNAADVTLSAATPSTLKASVCAVCMVNDVLVAFSPCGHVSACMQCTRNIVDADGNLVCIICSAHVDNVIRLYYCGVDNCDM
jgi:hypothetical protein